jgi:hypothetical protein
MLKKTKYILILSAFLLFFPSHQVFASSALTNDVSVDSARAAQARTRTFTLVYGKTKFW